MKTARIRATGSYLPGAPITNDDLAARIGPLDEEVLASLGIRQRHWIADPDTGEHRETNADLAVKAARFALEAAGLDPAQVDLIVVATGTPDQLLPPMVTTVQARLGLAECTTIEVRSGGAGTVQGLDFARIYLEQGRATTAMVIGSDVVSPVLVPMFLGRDPETLTMRDRVPVFMFGDGAGAFIVEASDGEAGIHAGVGRSIGGHWKPGVEVIGGGTDRPLHEQLGRARFVELRVNLAAAAEAQPKMLRAALRDLLGQVSTDREAVTATFVPGGTAPWLVDALAGDEDWIALWPTCVDDLATTGAIGCASVPVSIDRHWRAGALAPGDEVLILGVEATKWIYAGVAVRWTAQPASSPASDRSAGR